MKDAVVVLGMHRSGTSSVAGALKLLGAATPLNAMRPDSDNERGYFESYAIMELNDAIFESGGSSWADWRAFNPGWFKTSTAHQFQTQASAIILDEFQAAPFIALKDPRICRLVPFWFDTLAASGYRGHALTVVRNPLEVAASLRKRNGFSVAHSLLFWLRHVLDAEVSSRGTPRSTLVWSEMLKDWRSALTQVSVDLGLAWPRSSDTSFEELDRFFSAELRHHDIDDEVLEVRRDISDWVRLTYDAMKTLSREPNSNSAFSILDRVRSEFNQSVLIFGPAFAGLEHDLKETVSRARVRAEDLESQVQASQARLDEVSENNLALQGEIAAKAEALRVLSFAAADLQAERDRAAEVEAAFAHAQHELSAKVEAMAAELGAARAEIDVERDRADRAEQAQAELAVQAAASAARLELARAEVDQDRERLAAIERSLHEALAENGRHIASEALLRDAQDAKDALVAQLQEKLGADAAIIERREAEVAAGARRIARLGDDMVRLRLRSGRALVRDTWARARLGRGVLAHAVLAVSSVHWLMRGCLKVGLRKHKAMLAIRRSGLFDEAHYLTQCPTLDGGPLIALEHYFTYGGSRDLNPNPMFDNIFYLRGNPDVAHARLNPLLHFIQHGAQEGRAPHPRFDIGFYLDANPDVRRAGLNPLRHYLHHGRFEGRQPSAGRAPDSAGLTSDSGDPAAFDAASASEARAAPHPSQFEDLDRFFPDVRAAMVVERVREHEPARRRALQTMIDDAREWRIPTSDTPVVSVIVPTYNGLHFTLACLESIARHSPVVPFEVIVADNQSTDETESVLKDRDDILYLRNPENLGYLKSCNRAVTFAKGEYVFQLNNDTVVRPGWLDALVETFQNFDNVGLVGSKLIFPDGTLQEAGGILWDDGSAWNYGRGSDPSLPVYCYARETDYVSGAAIMLPTELWTRLGGYDELFVPSYCEDSDLALRVRALGYSVIYQPTSTIVHMEGMTQGRDVSTGIKAYQVKNTVKLRDRWKDYFKTLQSAGVDVDQAKDRGVKRRALYIDNTMITPDQDAGSLTSMNLMLLLQQNGFLVTFVPQDNMMYLEGYTEQLQKRGIEVVHAPGCWSIEQHIREHGDRYDLIFIMRPQSYAAAIDAIDQYAPQAKTIYHTCDLHWIRMQREVALGSKVFTPRDIEEMRQLEMRAIADCGAVIVHSDTEKKLLNALVPTANVKVFGWAIPVGGLPTPFSQRSGLLFLGGFQHRPNVDAAVYFAKEILPRVRRERPDIIFNIVGSKAPPEVMALEGPNVRVHGFVEDLTEVLASNRLFVAPLRYGAGIKGKVAMALSVGLPSVLTTIAAEGMNITSGLQAFVDDDPQTFAEHVLRAYDDETLWRALAKNGLTLADQLFGPGNAVRIASETLQSVGLQPAAVVSAPRLMGSAGMATPAFQPPDRLEPVACLRSKPEWDAFAESAAFADIGRDDSAILTAFADRETWTLCGYSEPASRFVNFLVDMKVGGGLIDGRWVPNLRERLVCPLSSLNNRQRLIASVARQAVEPLSSPSIYMMEEITIFSNWLRGALPEAEIIGSEYLGPQYKGGEKVNGVRHEDVNALSFASGRFDLIVSNDVMEHVPTPERGFAECARILRPGGVLLMTIPFSRSASSSVTRAIINERGVENLLPPVFHGNPVSAEGSLVFTDYGWDVLDLLNHSGFEDARLELYHSTILGHLGEGLMIFRARKP